MTMTDSTESHAEGITCVIPVYNEAGAVAATLTEVEAALVRVGRPTEIIVVDDGSSDGSFEAADEAAEASSADVRVLRHEINRGYGAAIKTGLRSAQYPWILIIDADGTYPPREIGKLVAALDEAPSADMIVGQRTQTLATDGYFRLQGKRILMATANFLSGVKIPDLNSGLRLMRTESLKRFRPLLPDGFSLTTSITLALLCSGGYVRYVPIDYLHRVGESKIRPLRDMTNFIALIARTITYFNPLKVYVPLALTLIFLAILTIVLSKALGGQVMDVTALFLFVGGLQMLLIGVVADLVLMLIGTRDN